MKNVFKIVAGNGKTIMIKNCLFLILVLFPLLGVTAPPPPAEDVFQLSAKQIDPNTLALDWTIKKGFFLYKNRIKLTEGPERNLHLGKIRFPMALQHKNTQGKIYKIYRENLTLAIAILGEQTGEALLEVHYQGCSDNGFCYPPQTQQLKLTIDKDLALTNVSFENTANTTRAALTTPNETDKLDRLFSDSSWPIIILSFFGFGLLLSFTPCILPMIPVLSGIIVGHGNHLSTRKAFFLSLSYVLSMSFTYAVIGAIIALMGSNLQIVMQSPWAVGIFSILFILLALSMFGFYQLQLPIAWQAKLAQVTRSQNGGHYLSSALMGSLSILILSPCVTAPLIGALGYIAQTGNVALGSLSLFFLSLGMGTPLLLIGTSAGKLLPRVGAWMNTVKSFFGIMLLAVAIYLMGRILPPTLIMGLWAGLLIFSGIYMGALTRSRTNHDKFCQGVGIILLGYGLLVLVGASLGKSNPLQPLAPINKADYHPDQMIVVKTLGEARLALEDAKGGPVILDFYADWCASCKVIARTTLLNTRVRAALNDFTVLKVDLTPNNTETKAILNHFKVVAPPTFLFFDAEGHELDKLRLVGEISATSLCRALNQARTDSANA